MRIVTFYSYKGGQGRSTAVANMASCLYQLDKSKSIVILDLDVEAPGLPPKCVGESVFAEDTRVERAGGTVLYIRNLVKGYPFGRLDAEPPSIQEYAIPISGDEHEGELSLGKLLLIPTGRVDKQYRQWLEDDYWLRFAHTATLRERVRYLDAVARAVESMSPPVDYMFVDLGCGLSRLASAVFAAWAGPILLFFSMDQENIEGTTHILNEIWETPGERDAARLDRDTKILPYPVLSRAGPFLNEEDAAKLRDRAAKDFGASPTRKVSKHTVEPQDVLYLRSDPDLEARWELRFPIGAAPNNLPLTRDYLRVLATVLPELASGQTVEERVEQLRSRLGIPERVSQWYKIFRIGRDGLLINMSDAQRNVSFKVQTFCAMLDDIHRQIVEGERGTVSPGTPPADRLKEAGTISGKTFGEALLKLWVDRGHDRNDIAGLLQYWCEFDSDIGFGALSADLLQGGVEPQGVVRVAHNFLAEGREGKPDLCSLFSGYIEGLLTMALGRTVEVTHGEAACMRLSPRDHCAFSFESQSLSR